MKTLKNDKKNQEKKEINRTNSLSTQNTFICISLVSIYPIFLLSHSINSIQQHRNSFCKRFDILLTSFKRRKLTDYVIMELIAYMDELHPFVPDIIENSVRTHKEGLCKCSLGVVDWSVHNIVFIVKWLQHFP